MGEVVVRSAARSGQYRIVRARVSLDLGATYSTRCIFRQAEQASSGNAFLGSVVSEQAPEGAASLHSQA
jgi:hypothetical protein